MFFTVEKNKYLTYEQLRTNTLLDAYYIISKYPLHSSELLLDSYIQQQYKTSLKNMCIKLLLNLTYHKDKDGNLVLIFKNQEYDKIARIITYGTGVIPGSMILKTALK